MPIFEFRCACGHTFERLSRGGGGEAPACPRCGGAAEKIFSSFNVGRAAPAAGCTVEGPPPGGCSSCRYAGHYH